MKRSIRKSISVNEIKWVFGAAAIPDGKRADLVIELFDETSSDANTYLLKPAIRSLDEFKKKVRSVLNSKDQAMAILNCFEVQDDLHLPKDLKGILLNSNNIAFFVGAGVSRLLGIPLWDELAGKAIEYLRDMGHINYSEELKLRNEKYQAKQIMSIFHGIVKNKAEVGKFYQNHFKVRNRVRNNPYQLIADIEHALQKPVIKITTNIDSEWEKYLAHPSPTRKSRPGHKILPDNLPFRYEMQHSDFRVDQEVRPEVLYHIHGTFTDIENAILTTDNYVEKYSDEDGLKGFLKQIFRTHNVIFIGSGISEFEILEHCLKPLSRRLPCDHFSLIGTELQEPNLWRIKKEYFSQININAIPYYLDFQKYGRLLHVLGNWASELYSAKTEPFYDNTKLIDEVL